MRLKKLHILTLKAFLPPFFLSLFISVFLFFLVEVVITYLDDLIGKGLNTSDLTVLFVYAWIGIIPQCLPLSVLLASIMSFGNLAENYELAAMKSSGFSLFRIMKPVFILILFLAVITFLFNNYILPVVHLKSQTLLYDIRQKKPSVNIKEGVFFNGIENYTLRVGRKSQNKDTLSEIYIYDHSARNGNLIQMYSKSGKITMSADTNDLVLILNDGNRYEIKLDETGNSKSKVLLHLNYKHLRVNIPLENFKLKRTNEELFKGNEAMLNVWQINSEIDSSKKIINQRIENLRLQSTEYFYPRTTSLTKNNIKLLKISNIHLHYDQLNKIQYSQAIQTALNIVRSSSNYIENFELSSKNESFTLVNFLIEWHKKIVVSFACIVLFFIGAPLGAIIKKGGLGLPVVISVFFFLAYFIATEFFINLAHEGVMPPWQSLWMPLFIFLPISVFLTIKAANDSAIFDITIYYNFINKLIKKNKI